MTSTPTFVDDTKPGHAYTSGIRDLETETGLTDALSTTLGVTSEKESSKDTTSDGDETQETPKTDDANSENTHLEHDCSSSFSPWYSLSSWCLST